MPTEVANFFVCLFLSQITCIARICSLGCWLASDSYRPWILLHAPHHVVTNSTIIISGLVVEKSSSCLCCFSRREFNSCCEKRFCIDEFVRLSFLFLCCFFSTTTVSDDDGCDADNGGDFWFSSFSSLVGLLLLHASSVQIKDVSISMSWCCQNPREYNWHEWDDERENGKSKEKKVL